MRGGDSVLGARLSRRAPRWIFPPSFLATRAGARSSLAVYAARVGTDGVVADPGGLPRRDDEHSLQRAEPPVDRDRLVAGLGVEQRIETGSIGPIRARWAETECPRPAHDRA
jgi:hypothetical protein